MYTILFKLDVHLPIVMIVAVPLMFAGNALLAISVVVIAVKGFQSRKIDGTEVVDCVE